MKYSLLLFTFLLCYVGVAQRTPQERIKAFKIAYITEQLNLTTKEAQQFWPVYNTYEDNLDTVKAEERNLIQNLRQQFTAAELTDQKAGTYLDNFILLEEKKLSLRKSYLNALKKVIPNIKILKLIKAEADFNKRLVQQLRERRRNQRN
ncbi:sensor of ECF-type sigma factor [Aquimarina brevivitae]|nr:sensor of ECF-type sigma factor [Aquimarina brevivitae]